MAKRQLHLLEIKQDAENAEVGLPILNQVSVLESSKPSEIPIDKKVITPSGKIQLFMSLFKGREDIYAKRWPPSYYLYAMWPDQIS